MHENRKCIVVDTNVFISFLIGKELLPLKEKIFTGELILLMSLELLEELIQVVKREKFKKYFSVAQIEELILLLNELGHFIEVKSELNICRDKKDNFLLELAQDGNADYIVTGDADLLSLHSVGKTKIISFREFADFQ